MDFLYHSIFKEKLKEFGFDNPTFEDLYLFAESNNINWFIVSIVMNMYLTIVTNMMT